MKTTTTIAIIAAAAFISSCEQKTTTSADTPPAETAEVSTETTDTYPLKTCVVSGEELGGMGDPYVHVHEGTTVKFCCKSCLKDFNKDPDKYIAMIKEAEAK